MKKLFTITVTILQIIFVVSFINTSVVAQTQRNPVLEECTGTWCQWCPCGHEIMEQILHDMPNAIMIGYHGPANGSDPFSFFEGNQILSLMGFSAYPTAVIDRTGPPLSRSAWPGTMNQRYDVPATVQIELDKTYNKTTGRLTATVDVTALEDLTGEYKMTMILLEDSLIYSQAGNGSCTGGGNYIHNHVVRAIINGAQGEELNGTAPWNEGEVISKNIEYTTPEEIVSENCELVVIVNKVGSSFNSGEIQQAEKWTLTSPDYVASIISNSSDVIADNNTPASFSTILYNQGLLDDKYLIEPVLDGPENWTGEFTTVNGTFSFDEADSVEVAAGDSTIIEVTVYPNESDGFGITSVGFSSMNYSGTAGSVQLRNVTTTGVDVLVVDASAGGYASMIANGIETDFDGNYGIVSREAVMTPGLDLSGFYLIAWSAGNNFPVFHQEEVDNLESYLDGTGNLFINGQNIGHDIFEEDGQSQFAQDFYNNYLHAGYVDDVGTSFIIKGIDGEPLTEEVAFNINSLYERSPDWIEPFDNDASSILVYSGGDNSAGIKVETSTNKIIYLSIGLEQINNEYGNYPGARDTLLARCLSWLTEDIGLDVNDKNIAPKTFSLNQNYPNPFNPSTKIRYSVANQSPVLLKVYDITGQEVATLVNQVKQPGSYEVTFDATNLSSGVYFYKLSAGEFVSVKKMSILK